MDELKDTELVSGSEIVQRLKKYKGEAILVSSFDFLKLSCDSLESLEIEAYTKYSVLIQNLSVA